MASLAMARVRVAELCLSGQVAVENGRKAALVHLLPFARRRRLHCVSHRPMLSSSQPSSSSPSPLGSASLNSIGFRRPDEIPWQQGLVNSVTLIGHINQSVDLKYLDSGKITASTSLRVRRNPYLQEPNNEAVFYLQFWDELAEIAAAHLKKEDRVYIAGCVWVESFVDKESVVRSRCKVVGKDLKFVGEDYRERNASKGGGEHEENASIEDLWKDYFNNPSHFWDNRLTKRVEKAPDFKHKVSGVPLWISSRSTPSWVHLRLAEGLPNDENGSKANVGDRLKAVEKMWQDFFAAPTDWWDNRGRKITQNYPDFKNKSTGEGLWIESSAAPSWVKSQLELLDSRAKSLMEGGSKGDWASGSKERTPKTSFEDEDFNFF